LGRPPRTLDAKWLWVQSLKRLMGITMFETNPKKLKLLLEQIEHGELALPDFQRDFVWDPSAVEELIESIMRRYPAGSLLFLKDTGEKFQVREFATAPKLPSRSSHNQLVLDGQQRLTSLYQAFYGKGEHHFFINLNHLRGEINIEAAVFNRSSKAAQRQGLLDKNIQARDLIVPLSVMRDDNFEDWYDDILEIRKDPPEARDALKKDLKEIRKSLLSPMLNYEFPVITLDSNTQMEAVCRMFETLNRRGVKLTVFELLMARSFASNVSLRTLWNETLVKFPIIDEFSIDPYYVLQIVALINQGTVKRSDVLEIDPKIVANQWESVVNALAESLKFLQSEEGIFNQNLIPYNTMLVPLAAVMAKTSGTKEIEKGKRNLKLRKWFWASVFSSTYESSPTGQMVADYKELLLWIGGEERVMSCMKRLYLNEDILRETGPKQRARYNGVLCLLLQQGAKDFHNGAKITKDYLNSKAVDIHHIFPSNYLKKKNVSETLINCVLNKTLIDASTNRTISDNPPARYLEKIEKELGRNELNEILASHQIERTYIEAEDFEAFLNRRSQKVIELLAKKIGEVVQDKPQFNDDEISGYDQDDNSSKKDQQDQNLINKIPENFLKDYPPMVQELYAELFKRAFTIDKVVWSRANKDSISFWTETKSFFRALPKKSGIDLIVFIDGQKVDHIQNVIQSDNGGQLYGKAKIKSMDDLERILPGLKKSFDLMNAATASGKNTSWWFGKIS
jgi:hypothetical protein